MSSSARIQASPLVDTVLIIDDDPYILKALQRILRLDGFHVLKAESGDEAIEILKEAEDVAVIICDQHMPGVTGIEVLRESREINPDAMRILLTGDQDRDVAVNAVNIGQVSQILSKPWNDTTLRQTVKNGCEKSKLVRENRRLQEKIVDQHRALQKTHDSLQKDLQLGSRVHEVLLSGSVPAGVEGVKIEMLTTPSKEIDGDFCDFFAAAPDTLDILVGDVMGKGLPAALVGTAVKSQLMRFAEPFSTTHLFDQSGTWQKDLPTPAEIIHELQKSLAKKLIDLGYFVSLVYGRFNLRKQTFSYIDCGFTKPIHYSSENQQIRFLEGQNLPLGAIENDPPEEIVLDYQKDDVIVFYSDGATEARSDSGELFGCERLAKLVAANQSLPPKALLHLLTQNVVAFSGKEQQDDDLTLIVVKIGECPEVASSQQKRASFISDFSQLEAVRDFVHGICSGAPGDAELLSTQLQLAINEIFCNIVEHSCGTASDKEIVINAELGTDGVRFEILDRGQPFDPSMVDEPSLSGSRSHGFGLYIVREIADETSYVPKQGCEGWNHFRIYKRYQRGQRGMEITHEKDNDVLVIHLKSENLDAKDAPSFRDCVTGIINSEQTRNVVFDLDHLKFIDSSGLGSFLSVLRHVNSHGGDLKLARMHKPIKAMFEIVRMHKLFEIYNETNEAVKSFED